MLLHRGAPTGPGAVHCAHPRRPDRTVGCAQQSPRPAELARRRRRVPRRRFLLVEAARHLRGPCVLLMSQLKEREAIMAKLHDFDRNRGSFYRSVGRPRRGRRAEGSGRRS